MRKIIHYSLQMACFLACITCICGCIAVGSGIRRSGADDVRLHLLPIGNVAREWPPSVLVERYDSHGVNVGNIPSKYSPGVAILLVENQGSQKRQLQPWSSSSWSVTVRLRNDSLRTLPLVPYSSSLPSYNPPGLLLNPQEILGYVVVSAHDGPFTLNPQTMAVPADSAVMTVSYKDGDLVLQSSELPITCPPLTRKGKKLIQ